MTKRKKRTQLAPEQWYPAFLAVLRQTGNVSLSCQHAHISRDMAYNHRKGNAAFAAAWKDALEDAGDALVAEARCRAVIGVESRKLILYKGEPVIDWSVPGKWVDQLGRDWVEGQSQGERRWLKAEWVDDAGRPWQEGVSPGRKRWSGAYLQEVQTRYSDALLTLLIKAAKPEEFSDRMKIDQGAVTKEAEKIAEALGVPLEELVAEIKAIQAEAGVS